MELTAENDKRLSLPATPTIINAGTYIVGEIDCSTQVHIDGKAQGNIYSTEFLMVGRTGYIECGKIHTERLIITGIVVVKELHAKYIEISSTGMLIGNLVTTQQIVMAKGSLFFGKIIKKVF